MDYFLLFLPFALSGFVDYFFKERSKQKVGWKNIPHIYHHPQWLFIVIPIWMIGLLLLAYFRSPVYLVGFLMFYVEDWFYYLFTWMEFNLPMPDNLPWLHGDIKWLEKLVGDFSLETYKNILIIQVTVVTFLWWVLT